jgi:hypothetical protein
MTLSRRSKATLVSALAFATALFTYLVWPRSEPRVSAGEPANSNNAESVSQGRLLGRKLTALLNKPAVAEAAPEPPTHVAGPACDKCTTENCAPGDDGCDSIRTAADRKLCEDLYACFADAKNNCVIQGDPLRCWCGTNMLTCVTESSGPQQANGPCVKQVLAAAKSSDADTIFHQFLNADLPLGRAARLTSCRGSFCSTDCNVR